MLRYACLISFGLHATFVAASARWWVDLERAPVEEEEFFSLQIKPRSGEPTGALEGAVTAIEITGATLEPVDAISKPVGAEERALEVVSPLFEEVAATVALAAESAETASDVAAAAPEIEAAEGQGAAAENSAGQASTVAAASPGSSSTGGVSTGHDAPASRRLGVPTGAPDGPSAANASGDDLGPLVLDAPAPVYPPACVRSGKEGSVLCALHISTTGRVTNVEVLQSSGHRQLDEAARTTLSRWRFEPARKDGTAVPARIQHRVHFRLE